MLARASLVDGRVRIPDSVRAALAILPGDPMLFAVDEDADAIVLSRLLHPAASTAPRRAVPAQVLPLTPRGARRRVRG